MGSTAVGKVAGIRFWYRIERYCGLLELVKRGAAEVVTTPFVENLGHCILDKHILKKF